MGGLILSGLSKNLYRGDKNYKGGSIGQPIDGDISAQEILDHLDEKGNGKLTSLTEKYSVAKGKFGKPVKISKSDLAALEAKKEIRIISSDQAREIINNDPTKRKIRKQVNNAKTQMDGNSEILIQGEMPEDIIGRCK